MSIAIKGHDGSLIWLDAVLEFSKQYQSQVTNHPVETGGNITDHVIEQNPKFRIRGVFTDADFNTARPNINLTAAGDGIADEATYKSFLNNTPVYQTPTISFGKNPLVSLLPSSVTQFLGEDSPTVTVYESTKEFTADSCFAYLHEAFKLRKTVTVVYYKPTAYGDNMQIFDDMIITGVSETLDPESGDARYPDITFEKVTFATSQQTNVPKRAVAKAAASKKSKGKVNTKDTTKTYDFVDQQQKERDSLSAKEQAQSDAEKTVKDTK